jgi:hypothetical protein
MQPMILQLIDLFAQGSATEEQTRNALVALAMGLAIFCSSLAFGVAYGIRRKIDQIAGPPEEEDDD